MREITGRDVLLVSVAAFGTIIAVNVVLAVNAVRTFPGLEVKNSYVASQNFDRETAAQEALGWTLTSSVADGELRLGFTDARGAAIRPASVTATIGRPTLAADDVVPDLALSDGVYVAPVTLDRGNWVLWVVATAEDGTAFRQRLPFTVRP